MSALLNNARSAGRGCWRIYNLGSVVLQRVTAQYVRVSTLQMFINREALSSLMVDYKQTQPAVWHVQPGTTIGALALLDQLQPWEYLGSDSSSDIDSSTMSERTEGTYYQLMDDIEMDILQQASSAGVAVNATTVTPSLWQWFTTTIELPTCIADIAVIVQRSGHFCYAQAVATTPLEFITAVAEHGVAAPIDWIIAVMLERGLNERTGITTPPTIINGEWVPGHIQWTDEVDTPLLPQLMAMRAGDSPAAGLVGAVELHRPYTFRKKPGKNATVQVEGKIPASPHQPSMSHGDDPLTFAYLGGYKEIGDIRGHPGFASEHPLGGSVGDRLKAWVCAAQDNEFARLTWLELQELVHHLFVGTCSLTLQGELPLPWVVNPGVLTDAGRGPIACRELLSQIITLTRAAGGLQGLCRYYHNTLNTLGRCYPDPSTGDRRADMKLSRPGMFQARDHLANIEGTDLRSLMDNMLSDADSLPPHEWTMQTQRDMAVEACLRSHAEPTSILAIMRTLGRTRPAPEDFHPPPPVIYSNPPGMDEMTLGLECGAWRSCVCEWCGTRNASPGRLQPLVICCGLCGHPISREDDVATKLKSMATGLPVETTDAIRGILNLRTMSTLLDGWQPDNSSTYTDVVNSHDFRLTALHLSRIKTKVIALPGRFNNETLEWLSRAFPAFELLNQPSSGTGCALLLAISDLMTLKVTESMVALNHVVYNRPEWFPPLTNKGTTLRHFSQLRASHDTIVQALTNDDGDALITTLRTQVPQIILEGAAELVGAGAWRSLIYLDSDTVVRVNYDFCEALDKGAVIQAGDRVYQVLQLDSVGPLATYYLHQPLDCNDVMGHHHRVVTTDSMQFTLPVASTTSIVGLLDSNLTTEVVELNKDLMLRGLTRAMMPNLTFTDMLEYYRAVAYRKYHTVDNVIKTIDVSAEQAYHHAYAVTVLASRANAMRDTTANHLGDKWARLRTGGMNKAVQLLMRSLGPALSLTSDDIATAIEGLSGMALNTLNSLATGPVWDSITVWAYGSKVDAVDLFTLGRAPDPEAARCPHGGPLATKGKRICICCAGPSYSDYCTTCIPESVRSCWHKLTHTTCALPHDLHCSCCGDQKACSDPCYDCEGLDSALAMQPNQMNWVEEGQKRKQEGGKERQPGPPQSKDIKANETGNNKAQVPATSTTEQLVDAKKVAAALTRLGALIPLDIAEAIASGTGVSNWLEDVNRMGVGRLRGVPPGSYTLENTWLQVLNTASISQSQQECGLETLLQLTNSQSRTSVVAAVGRAGGWTATEFGQAAMALHINVLIMSPASTALHVNCPSDEIYLVIHSAVLGASTGMHWLAMQATSSERLPTMTTPITGLNPNYLDTRIMTVTQWAAPANQLKRLEQALQLVGMLNEKSNVTWKWKQGSKGIMLSNSNFIHEPDLGKYSIWLPEQMAPACELLINPGVARHSPLYTQGYDVPHGLQEDYSPTYNAQLQSALLDMAATLAMPGLEPGHEWMKRFTTEVVECIPIAKGKVRLVTPRPLKTGDVVYIKTGAWMPYSVLAAGGHPMVTAPLQKMAVTVMIPKASFGSHLRTLMAADLPYLTAREFNAMVESARVTLGVYGSGKSTTMVQEANQHYLLTAATSGSLNSIRKKAKRLNKKVTVCSIERATYDVNAWEGITHLAIDEGAALTVTQLYMMCRKPVQLHLLGDPFQVGTVDFNPAAGTRDITPAYKLSKVTPAHLTTENRIGEPLASCINAIHPWEITCGATHTTSVRLEYTSSDLEQVVPIIVATDPDAVLVHTEACMVRLKSALRKQWKGPREQLERILERVRKIHANQGDEWPSVLVVQWRISEPGIEISPQYNYSALTRATKHLTWVSAGLHPTGTPLPEMAGSLPVGYGWWTNRQPTFSLPNNVRLGGEDPGVISVNRIRDLVTKNANAYGAVARVDRHEQTDTIMISKYGVPALSIDVDIKTKKASVTLNQFNVPTEPIITQLEATYTMQCKDTIKPTFQRRPTQLSHVDDVIHRLALLDQLVGLAYGSVPLPIGMDDVTAVTGRELDNTEVDFFYKNEPVLKFTQTARGPFIWWSTANRHTVVVATLLRYFDVEVAGVETAHLYTPSFDEQLPILHTHHVWAGRLRKLWRFLEDLTVAGLQSLGLTVETSTTSKAERWLHAIRQYREAQVVGTGAHVVETAIPAIIGETCWHVVKVMNAQGYVSYVVESATGPRFCRADQTGDNGLSIGPAEMTYMAMQRLRTLRSYESTPIGFGDGLVRPLEWHHQHNTKVARLLTNVVAQTTAKAMSLEPPTLYIGAGAPAETKALINAAIPRVPIEADTHAYSPVTGYRLTELCLLYVVRGYMPGVVTCYTPHVDLPLQLSWWAAVTSGSLHGNPQLLAAKRTSAEYSRTILTKLSSIHRTVADVGSLSEREQLAITAISDRAKLAQANLDGETVFVALDQQLKLKTASIWLSPQEVCMDNILQVVERGVSTIYTAMPSVALEAEIGRDYLGNSYIQPDGELGQCFRRMSPLVVSTSQCIQPELITSCLGMSIYRLNVRNGLNLDYYSSPPLNTHGLSLRRVRLPYIHTSALIASRKLVVEVRDAMIEARLLRHLELRMLGAEVSFDDLKATATVALSGMFYTATNVAPRETINPDVMVDTALYAWLKHHDVLKGLNRGALLTRPHNTGFLSDTLQHTKDVFGGLVGLLLNATGLDGNLLQLVDELLPESDFDEQTKFQDLQPRLLGLARPIMHYRLTDGKLATAMCNVESSVAKRGATNYLPSGRALAAAWASPPPMLPLITMEGPDDLIEWFAHLGIEMSHTWRVNCPTDAMRDMIDQAIEDSYNLEMQDPQVRRRVLALRKAMPEGVRVIRSSDDVSRLCRIYAEHLGYNWNLEATSGPSYKMVSAKELLANLQIEAHQCEMHIRQFTLTPAGTFLADSLREFGQLRHDQVSSDYMYTDADIEDVKTCITGVRHSINPDTILSLQVILSDLINSFTPVAAIQRHEYSTLNVVALSIGSMGDFLPIYHVCRTLAEAGANVVLHCADELTHLVQPPVKLGKGGWSIEQSLTKYTKLRAGSYEERLQGLGSFIQTNCFTRLELVDHLGCNLVLGTSISTESYLLAYAMNAPLLLVDALRIGSDTVAERISRQGLSIVTAAYLDTKYRALTQQPLDYYAMMATRTMRASVTLPVLAANTPSIGGWGEPFWGEVRGQWSRELPNGSVVVTAGSMNDTSYLRDLASLTQRITLPEGGVLLVQAKIHDQMDPNAREVVPFTSMDYLATLTKHTTLICHGGVGTIMSACRVGAHLVIVPFAFDQHSNAGIMSEHGALHVARDHIQLESTLSKITSMGPISGALVESTKQHTSPTAMASALCQCLNQLLEWNLPSEPIQPPMAVQPTQQTAQSLIAAMGAVQIPTPPRLLGRQLGVYYSNNQPKPKVNYDPPSMGPCLTDAIMHDCVHQGPLVPLSHIQNGNGWLRGVPPHLVPAYSAARGVNLLLYSESHYELYFNYLNRPLVRIIMEQGHACTFDDPGNLPLQSAPPILGQTKTAVTYGPMALDGSVCFGGELTLTQEQAGQLWRNYIDECAPSDVGAAIQEYWQTYVCMKYWSSRRHTLDVVGSVLPLNLQPCRDGALCVEAGEITLGSVYAVCHQDGTVTLALACMRGESDWLMYSKPTTSPTTGVVIDTRVRLFSKGKNRATTGGAKSAKAAINKATADLLAREGRQLQVQRAGQVCIADILVVAEYDNYTHHHAGDIEVLDMYEPGAIEWYYPPPDLGEMRFDDRLRLRTEPYRLCLTKGEWWWSSRILNERPEDVHTWAILNGLADNHGVCSCPIAARPPAILGQVTDTGVVLDTLEPPHSTTLTPTGLRAWLRDAFDTRLEAPITDRNLTVSRAQLPAQLSTGATPPILRVPLDGRPGSILVWMVGPTMWLTSTGHLGCLRLEISDTQEYVTTVHNIKEYVPPESWFDVPPSTVARPVKSAEASARTVQSNGGIDALHYLNYAAAVSAARAVPGLIDTCTELYRQVAEACNTMTKHAKHKIAVVTAHAQYNPPKKCTAINLVINGQGWKQGWLNISVTTPFRTGRELANLRLAPLLHGNADVIWIITNGNDIGGLTKQVEALAKAPLVPGVATRQGAHSPIGAYLVACHGPATLVGHKETAHAALSTTGWWYGADEHWFMNYAHNEIICGAGEQLLLEKRFLHGMGTLTARGSLTPQPIWLAGDLLRFDENQWRVGPSITPTPAQCGSPLYQVSGPTVYNEDEAKALQLVLGLLHGTNLQEGMMLLQELARRGVWRVGGRLGTHNVYRTELTSSSIMLIAKALNQRALEVPTTLTAAKGALDIATSSTYDSVDNPLRGTGYVAHCINITSVLKNGEVVAQTTDHMRSEEDVPAADRSLYRHRETGPHRNHTIRQLHNCDYPANPTSTDTRCATWLAYYISVADTIDAIVAQHGGEEWHITSYAQWDLPAGRQGINIIYKAEEARPTWHNVLITSSTGYTTEGRHIRLLPWVLCNGKTWWRCVAGRDQSNRGLDLGVMQGTSPLPRVRGWIVQEKVDGDAPVYLNNALAKGGTLVHLANRFVWDMLNVAHWYGSDEHFTLRFARNYTIHTGVEMSQDWVMPFNTPALLCVGGLIPEHASVLDSVRAWERQCIWRNKDGQIVVGDDGPFSGVRESRTGLANYFSSLLRAGDTNALVDTLSRLARLADAAPFKESEEVRSGTPFKVKDVDIPVICTLLAGAHKPRLVSAAKAMKEACLRPLNAGDWKEIDQAIETGTWTSEEPEVIVTRQRLINPTTCTCLSVPMIGSRNPPLSDIDLYKIKQQTQHAGPARTMWFHEQTQQQQQLTQTKTSNITAARYTGPIAFGVTRDITSRLMRSLGESVAIDHGAQPGCTKDILLSHAMHGADKSMHAVLQRTHVPARMILLTWGPETCPPTVPYGGNFMLGRSAWDRDSPAELREVVQAQRVDYRTGNGHPTYICNSLDELVTTMKETMRRFRSRAATNNASPKQARSWEAILEAQGPEVFEPRTWQGDSIVGQAYSQPMISMGSHSTYYEPGYRSDSIKSEADIAYWNDRDQTGEIHLFLSPHPFRSTEQPGGTFTSSKATTTPLPHDARPMHTKMYGGELNCVTTRLGYAISYRKHKPPPNWSGEFGRTYFKAERNMMSASNRKDKLGFVTEDIVEWLRGRSGIKSIDNELDKIESEGIGLHPINALNVHRKLESLLKSAMKDQPIWKHNVRAIVWQQKGITALFAPAFLKAKQRLKELLRPEIVYADGLTRGELCDRVAHVPNEGVWLMENDLVQQDKQTDQDMIDCEFMVYRDWLGVDPHLLSLWRTAHNHWSIKGQHLRGVLDAMRQTGQATTALGNYLVNLMCHQRFVARLGQRLLLMLGLGDDNLSFIKGQPDTAGLKTEIKQYCNMQCTTSATTNGGVFLRHIAYRTEQGWGFGPDYVRLDKRYAVFNGNVQTDPAAVYGRIMSYCCMLGPTKAVKGIIALHHLPIEPEHDYDMALLVPAIAQQYSCSLEQVETHYSNLVHSMRAANTHIYSWQLTGTARL
ncbi:polyprotein [Hygrophorus penarioides endornavirus 1]|nr:polyprotein [Hygrophorus penarioides endornavirus 1]